MIFENADAIAAMEQAAQGDMAALDELRDLATKDIIQNMDIQIGSGDEEGVEAARTKLLELQQSLQNELDNTPLEARAKLMYLNIQHN